MKGETCLLCSAAEMLSTVRGTWRVTSPEKSYSNWVGTDGEQVLFLFPVCDPSCSPDSLRASWKGVTRPWLLSLSHMCHAWSTCFLCKGGTLCWNVHQFNLGPTWVSYNFLIGYLVINNCMPNIKRYFGKGLLVARHCFLKQILYNC